MNAEELRRWIDSLTDDIEFKYNGMYGSICPFTRENIALCYGNETITVESLEAAMTFPFVNGKSLEQICNDLEF